MINIENVRHSTFMSLGRNRTSHTLTRRTLFQSHFTIKRADWDMMRECQRYTWSYKTTYPSLHDDSDKNNAIF